MQSTSVTVLFLVALVVVSAVPASSAAADRAFEPATEAISGSGAVPQSTQLDATDANGTTPDTFSATVVVETESARFGGTTEARVWADRSSGAYRVEFLDRENATWDVVVSNGSRVWAYHGEENRVAWTDEVHGSFVDQITDVVRPFYFDDFFYSSADLAERLDAYHVRALGRETVRGREAFALQLRKAGTAPRIAPEETTLWLDANYSFPVRIESVSRDGFSSDSYRTVTYRNLTFGESIDPDRFVLDPPTGATVTQKNAFRPTSVLEPGLPADFQQTRRGSGGAATYEDGQQVWIRRTVTARYQNLTTTVVVENHTRPNPRGEFTVGEGPSTIRENLDDQYPMPANGSLVPAAVGGATGAAWTENGTAYVAWPCEESYFVVHGDLSRSEVVEVAQTIPCGNESAEIETALGRDDSPERRFAADATESSDGTRVAPGVTTAAVVDPARLLAAHHESVTEGDFVAVLNETRTVRREGRTETLPFGQRFRYDGDSGTYLATYRNESASDRGPTVVWGNGTTAVARTGAYGRTFYEPPAAPSSSVPTGSSYLLSLFARYDFAVVETTNLTDTTRTEVVLEAEHDAVAATLVLDSDGRIYEFSLSRSSAAGDSIRSVEYELRPGETVERLRPGWVGRAPADARLLTQLSADVHGNFVWFSHEYGEPIPADSVVELRTPEGTYENRFADRLEPDENRQLFVHNDTLFVTTDRLAAERLGRNLSSPVELLVYTDDGVLLYHRVYRWSDDERPALEPSFAVRSPRQGRSRVPVRS